MGFRKTFSGKETYVPQSFSPTAGEAELVSRVGVYDDFDNTANKTPNVAWGANTDPFSGAYDDRNILIHHIKVTNEDFDKYKEIHFWSNDYTGRSLSNSNYLFDIPMAITKDDADGRVDTVIDFPIPLLVMGGCRIGVKETAGHAGAFDYDARVEICYTVLDGTADSADFDSLKYQYLSAFSSYQRSADAEFVIQPDSTSATWTEDIEIWGGMVMNYKNAGGSKEVAYSEVLNADGDSVATISVIKGETNAFRLNFPVGIEWPSYSGSWTLPSLSGSWPTLVSGTWPGVSLDPPGLSGGSWPSFSGSFPTLNAGGHPDFNFGHIIWAEDNSKTKADTAAAVSNSAIVTLENNTDSWMADEIKVGDVVTDEDGASKGTVITVTSQNNITLSATTSIDDEEELTFSRDDRKTWSLKAAGSDTQVTFYPYPVYCAGNAAGASNMKIRSGALSDNETRATWFYRPVHAQGIDHGWV